jgi:hypothetical protein
VPAEPPSPIPQGLAPPRDADPLRPAEGSTCSPPWPPSPTPGAARRVPPPAGLHPAAGRRRGAGRRPLGGRDRPGGPLTRPRRCAPRWAPAATPDRPADGPGRVHHPPPSAAPWAASTTRRWRWRSAPGWPTVTGVSGVGGGSGADGGRGRRHHPARRPPPTRRPPGPPARRDGPHHPYGPGPTRGRRRPGDVPGVRALLAGPDLAGAVVTATCCTPPRRRRRVPGGRQARPLPVHGQGQPSPPCWHAAPACPGSRCPWQTAPATRPTAGWSCAPSRR